MTEQDEDFDVTDAGASKCEKTDTNRLKSGSLVMIKGNPCKVTDTTTAKPGKHGSAKVILKGRDIITAKVYECTFHAGDMVDAPIVSRQEYTLLNIDDLTLEFLTPQGEVKSDVNIPEAEHLKDVKNNIIRIFEEGKKECLVTVLNVMGKELVIEVREGNDV
jgi:translation initiation factor 5A